MQPSAFSQKLAYFWQTKFVPFLGSRTFFYIIVALFVVQAAWLAISAQYPMAFDENYHYGIIQIYAERWLPFFSGQPTGADSFGAIARDPSYLYHYLMSFPWRLISAVIPSSEIQIVLMRFINVSLFAGALWLFRMALRQTKASYALINVILLFFVLVPVVPQLAAHINYDNLLIVCVASISWLCLKVGNQLKAGVFPVKSILTLGTICLLASLVKYAFLPIFLAVIIYLVYIIWRYARGQWRHRLTEVWQSIKGQKKWLLIVAAIGLVISGGLFFERYGINTILFKNPVPDCDQVLDTIECMSYGPWARNYQLTQVYANQEAEDWVEVVPGKKNAFSYSGEWITEMMSKLFFSIDGDYTEKPPLPIPITTGYVVGVVGVVLLLMYGIRVFRRHRGVGLIVVMILLYTLALWWRNYSEYRSIGEAVAVNGRYLIPLLPVIFLMLGYGFKYFFENLRLLTLKPLMVVVCLVLFLQGGGIMTYIIRSDPRDPDWYWRQPQIVNVNNDVRAVLHKVVIGSE